MSFYAIFSAIKIVVGIAIVLLVYFFVNVYEDPVVGIGLGFLGFFIAVWGISFFLFYFGQNIFRKVSKLRIVKDSYKLSLLFGIYAMINVLLLFLWHWTRLLGFLLFLGFVLLQVMLFVDSSKKID